MMDESPQYVVINGSAAALATNPMKVKVGDNVRIFFGVGGPNLTSSFHIIGAIFDKVYAGSLTSTPLTDVQTTMVPAAGSTMVKLNCRVPAKFIFVDHSLTRLQKGASQFSRLKARINLICSVQARRSNKNKSSSDFTAPLLPPTLRA